MKPRSPLSVALVAFALASPALADDPPAAPAPSGGVTFTPGPAPLGAVTFTPGPASLGPVTFTPGRDPRMESPPARAPEPAPAPEPIAETPTTPSPFIVVVDAPVPTAAPAPVSTPAPVPAPVSTPVPAPVPVPAAAAPSAAPAPLPVAAPTSARVIAPSAAPTSSESISGAYDCRAGGPIARVDLEASGSLRAVQVALAARGDDAVALVTLGRPGGPREGMVYPASRLVRLPAEGEPTVEHAEGFEPDAAVALGADGGVFVVGYSRLDVRGGPEAAPSVRVAVLGGSHAVAARALPGSAGLKIDSAPVAFEGGYAVVLGRESQNADGSLGPVREWLYQFDARGELAREPRVIADAGSDDTMSRFRVGLGVVRGGGTGAGEELALGWTVAQGADAGVWVRRVRGGELLPTQRVSSRPAWGAQVAGGDGHGDGNGNGGDGGGVLFRTEGEAGAPIELWFQRWAGGEPAQRVGAGWDPSLAFVNGRVLVAGVTLRGEGGDEVSALLGVSRPGQPMRAVEFADAAGVTVERAVDSDLVGTAGGAVLGWIESERAAHGDPAGDAFEDPSPRHLAVARARCGR